MARTALGKTLALILAVSCLGIAGLRAGMYGSANEGWFFQSTSLADLPEAEYRLAEFLLLLPVAALVICVFRNVVGLPSFGTFAPVLIGLAFRELASWPGIVILVGILFVGWGLRRVLEPLHLLEVPRASLLLGMVVILLLGLIVTGKSQGVPASRYIALFPLVILTGMIERLWALEMEEGALASLRALLGTLAIAGCVSLVLAIPGLVGTLVRYPELMGLCLAGQLVLGRYTGYRLSELYRFRDLVQEEEQKKGRQILQVRLGGRGRLSV
jgi:hypothetical protein